MGIKMNIFNRLKIKILISILIFTCLSGCTILGYKKVQQYPEPDEGTSRAKVMLVGDFGSGLFDVMDFYIKDSVKGNLYLYADGNKINAPKVKNLGINMEIDDKKKVNEVYLPANINLDINTYGIRKSWVNTKICYAQKNINLLSNKEYVLSFDKIEADKTYCILNLYEIIINNNYKKSLKALN